MMAKKLRACTAIERWWSLCREFEVALVGVMGLVGFLLGIAFVINGNFYAIALPLKPVSASIHMWLLLIGVQSAFWAVVLPYMITWIWGLWPKGANVRGEFLPRVGVPFAAVAGTLIVLLILVELAKSEQWPPSTLNGVPIGNLQLFTIIGIGVAAIGVCGMFFVNWRMAADADRRKSGMLDLDRYLTLHQFLDLFLLLAALMLGLGVLATAFLREAYNASQSLEHKHLPELYVVTYGALFSAFLALYYGVCRTQFHAQGTRLRDAFAGPPPKTASALLKWADDRASLNALLRLRLHGLSAFGESFSVAIPFLTGIITSLLSSGITGVLSSD